MGHQPIEMTLVAAAVGPARTQLLLRLADGGTSSSEHGYGKHFGIVRVDYATQRRIPKRPDLRYSDIAGARNGGAA